MDKATKDAGTNVRKGIFSVVLFMRLNADTKLAEIVLMPNAPYDLASAWLAECNSALDLKWEDHVAYKAFKFIQSISGEGAYGHLKLVAYP